MRWSSPRPRGPVLCALLVCALLVCACADHAPSSSSTSAGGSGAADVAARIPAADWPEFDFNPQRSGVGPAHTAISAANLATLRLRRVRIDGIADSSAIALAGVEVRGRRGDLIALTTTYGKTIAIAPGSGTKLWEFSPRGVNSRPGNPQVTTASPVADPDRRFLYAASPDGVIHKLAVSSGSQVWSRRITFDPRHEKIASALNVSGEFVVAVTGGYIGDIPPYDGHVVTIDRATGRIVAVWNTQCADRHQLIAPSSCPTSGNRGDSAIWGRAGAVIEPDSGRILVATGNGPFDGRLNWGSSALELSPDASRLLQNWTPVNRAQLGAGDVDVGSTSPAVLPSYHGFRLAVQGGKDGRLHLLNLARLNGTPNGASAKVGGELGEVSAPGGSQVLTAPAVWRNGGRTLIFVANDSGSAAYQLVGGSHPRLRVDWQNNTPGTSPAIAGGLLYIYDELDGALNVRSPNSGVMRRSLPLSPGHWNSPIVVGGRIIEPTGSYHDSAARSTIAIYHLPGR